MSLLGITGAIGQGFMAGQNHIAQQDQNAANLKRTEQQMKFDTARLGALNEETAFNKAERERVNSLAQIYQEFGDKDWTDPEVHTAMTGKALQFMKPEEIAAVQQQSTALRQMAGSDAVDKFLFTNDLSGFGRALEQKMPGATMEKRGQSIVITKPDGTTESIDAKGLSVMLGMSGALARLQQHESVTAESQKAHLANRKTQSEINKNNRMYGTVTNPDGTTSTIGRAGSRAGTAGKPFDAIGSQEDYGKAWGDEDVFNRSRGHAYFRQMQDNNPKLFETESGQSMALTASRAMAEGSAEVYPIIAEDGSLQLRAKVGPNEYVLESGVPEGRMVEMMKQYTPADTEKPGRFKRMLGSTPQPPAGVDEQFIGQMYVNSLREQAVKTPSQFEAAWLMANEPDALQQAMQEVRDNEADVGQQRMVQAALTIQRGLNHLQAQPVKPPDVTPGSIDTAPSPQVEFSRAFNAAELDSDAARREGAERRASDWKNKQENVIPARTRQIETSRFRQALSRLRGDEAIDLITYGTQVDAIREAIEQVPELAEHLSSEEMEEVRRLQNARRPQAGQANQ